jgi:hypothetical protein
VFEVMCGIRCRWLVVNLPNHFIYFCFVWKKFFITLCNKLGISHLLVLGVSHCIYSQPLDPMGIHLLCYAHGEERLISHDSCPSTIWFVVFMFSNRHCVINWWCLHIGKCYHCQFLSTWFGFTIFFPHWVATIIAVQAKDGLYCDWLSTNTFCPLIVNVFTNMWTSFFISVPTWHGE